MPRVRVLHRSNSFGRELRVAEHIRKELTDIVRNKMRDPRVETSDITLTEVRVSRDLSFADIYLQCFGMDEPDQRQSVVSVFEKAMGFLRTELSQRMTMRTIPKLRFHYDDLSETGQRLDALIDQAMERESIVDGIPRE